MTQARSAELLEKLPKLNLIAQTGSHRSHVDIDVCTARGVAITALNDGGGQSHSTVELTWGLILSSLRHIGFEAEQLKRGVWQTTVGTGLRGKTLGVYALGNIGSKVAQIGTSTAGRWMGSWRSRRGGRRTLLIRGRWDCERDVGGCGVQVRRRLDRRIAFHASFDVSDRLADPP